jgi:hypothetical protein
MQVAVRVSLILGLAFLANVVSAPGIARAAAPGGVSFQGVVLSPAGSPINGNQDLRIRIFDDPVSAAPVDLIYEELHLNTTLIDGVFNVVIGTGTSPSVPFDAEIFANPDLWLEVGIAGEVLAPRTKLQSVAYALQCSNAETVSGIAAEDLITQVTPGPGLLGSTVSGSVTLSVDFTQTQARTIGNCGAGSSIRQINQDGTLVCEVDTTNSGDITGVVAGTGLTGGGPAGDVTLSIPTGGVTSTLIADGTVTGADIAADTIGAADIATGAVGTPEIADGSVSGVDIAAGTIASSSIADGSLAAVDLLDEAGADFASGQQALTLDPADVVARLVTLNVPVAGTVIANASGSFRFGSATLADAARCLITTGTVIDGVNGIASFETAVDSMLYVPFAITRGFSVAAGSVTINLVCDEFSGDVLLEDSALTAIFVPTVY